MGEPKKDVGWGPVPAALPVIRGGSVVEVEGKLVPVPAVRCVSDVHKREIPAVVSGEFRAPWWEPGRVERCAYCASCARMGCFMGMFTPDHGDWR